MPLGSALEHWRRAGAPVSQRGVATARRAIREAGAWLALPPESAWQRFEWQASAGVALIAIEVQMRKGTGCPATSAPPALRLLPVLRSMKAGPERALAGDAR